MRHDGNTLKKAKKFVFLTGAGISQESGISTFRGKDGIKYDIPVDRVGAYFGERKEIREITISTYQSAISDLDLIDNSSMIILDEVHLVCDSGTAYTLDCSHNRVADGAFKS